jgi:multiple sugar transport system substrate-binding protein
MVASALAGCAREPEGPPVIKFATWFGASEAKELAPIVEAINTRHKGEFRLEPMAIPGEYLTKIDAMMAARTAPDVFLLSQEYVPSYAAIGAAADMDARIKADTSLDLPDYYPASLETAKYKGHLYGLPWVMQPVVLYYNKKLFDEAKLGYPDASWDWAHLESAAKALTRREADGTAQQWGFLQYTWPPYQIWVWQNGGDVRDAQGQPTITSPETLGALEFMHKLVVDDKVSPGAGTVLQNGAAEMFKGGRIAMFMGGASDDLDRVPGLDVGVSEVPHGKTRATFSWMSHLMMSSQSKHPELAYVAWRELLDGFHHWKIVPPRRSLAKTLTKLEPRKAAAAGPILASMEYARGIEGIVEQTDWDAFVLNRLIIPMLNGEMTADAAAENTQKKLKLIVEETP